MSVPCVVTNSMIDCFQQCTQTEDFHPFLTEYQKFLKPLAVCTQCIVFSDDILCQTICENLRLLLSYLIKWNSKDAVEKSNFIKETAHLEDKIPKFVENLKLAIATSNWTKFYRQCRPIADKIIDEARRQNVFHMEISYKSCLYKNFEARELAINSEGAALKGKIEQKESSKTGQDNSKTSSTKDPLAGGPEDFKKVFQELSKSVEVIEEDIVKSFEALEGKTETRLRIMTTSINFTLESMIEELGNSLGKKIDEIATRLTVALVNNQKEIAEKLQSLEQEIKSDERSSEENMMKILEAAQSVELEDNEKMTARIENLFWNLQKSFDEMKVDSMRRNEQKLDELVTKIELQLKSKEEKLDRKMEEIKIREQTLDRKLEVMMDLIREGFEKNQQNDFLVTKTGSGTNFKDSKSTTEPGPTMEHKLEELVSKIEKNVQEQKEKMQQREKVLDKKMGEMMELMKKGFEQTTLRKTSETAEAQPSRGTNDDPKFDLGSPSANPDPSDRILPDYPEIPDLTSLPTSDLLNDDEELLQMQEAFEKQLAEQEARHAAEMNAVKERGRQKNEKAQKEIQDLSRNLSRH